ncbi:MAG TPA: magnesium transporter [Candidatus Paceibacterota bacterium]|nr:magnesium transporter [Candidatus Paceibacterota bacterium]HMO83128.1 magnesium transporter [Candidatus Paceibacterota bacterium]
MDKKLHTKAAAIARRPADRVSQLRSLSLPEQSAMFQTFSPHIQIQLLTELKLSEVVDILDHMDPRLAEIILYRLKDVKYRLRIIKKLKDEAREKIEYFLRFHPKATTSLISFNYILLSSRSTIGQAAEAIDEHFDGTGKFPEVLVQENGILVGEITMSTLVRERNTSTLKRFVRPVQTVTYQAEVAQIIETLTISHRKKVIVLDQDQSVLGLIYGDDAVALFGNLPAESLYNISGMDDTSRPFDSVQKKFASRYRWLILNLFTAFMAGSMIFLFKDTIDRLVLLAMYIPIVAGMGGNAASQVFAVMLRGITLGTINFRNGMPAIWREVQTGVLNGVVIGLIVALISIIWNDSALLGLVVGLSMVGVHIIAGFFGAFVPLFLKHLGKDPASTSTIFITTATDVLGLFILLGLGSIILL